MPSQSSLRHCWGFELVTDLPGPCISKCILSLNPHNDPLWALSTPLLQRQTGRHREV